jgi:hypothetical protein
MDGNNAFLRLSIFILGVVSTTIFAADSTQQSPEPLSRDKVWQHDLYRSDKSPYSETEIQLFEDSIKAVHSSHPSDIARGFWVKPVLLTSECLSQTWRYSTASPQGDWTASDYDDAQWKTGEGGFGTTNTLGLKIGTEWNTEQLWLRKEFTLESTWFSELYFRLFHDEEIWIYINGQPVLHRAGWTTEYINLPVLHDKKNVFKTGRNVIAIRCTQTRGGQGVDVGILDLQGHGSSRP